MKAQTQTNLQREITFLRGLVDRNMAGEAIPGEAFGIGARVDTPVWQSESMKFKDFCFTIRQHSGVLELELDTYTAINGGYFKPGEFDDDAWDACKIFIDSALPPCRDAYVHLHRAARMLLSGYDVRLADGTPEGTLVLGIKQGAVHAQA